MTSLRPTVRRLTVPLLLLALVADGYDTAAFAFVVPTLAREWGVHPAALTVPLVIANVGAVLGFVLCGWLSARWGRSAVIALSVAVFSLGTLLLPLVGSIALMSVVRLVIGVGFGAVIPAAVSLASDSVSVKMRDSVAIVVLIGLSVGFTLGGLTGGPLIATLGWHAVFWLPGAVCLVFALVLWRALPRTTTVDAGGQASASVRGLLEQGLRARTIMLWAFAFIVFAAYYTLQSWLPTLLVEVGAGFTLQQAPLAAAALGIGGIVGGLLLALGSAWAGVHRLIVVVVVVAVAFLVATAVAPVGRLGLLVLLAGVGAGLLASCNASTAMAVRSYGDRRRTTGVGWTTGFGRAGSIVGPALGSVVVALDQGVGVLVLGLVAPLLVACVLAVALSRRPARAAGLVQPEPVSLTD
ncbi:aromatic acid/H+ symport family MFS transporter [Pseudonocardia ailaonensis]|uniref:Aromatic acid/H+ symport family MFS transporter n=1 Tax=Pseudonocardia ailaonensis TaxID=367279 RepID=A0ABN2MH73_9PSEU